MPRLHFTLALLSALLAAQPTSRSAQETVLDMLLWGQPPTQPAVGVSPALHAAWEQYALRWRAYRPPRKLPRKSDARMAHEAWAAYERRLAAFSRAPRAAALAAVYVDELRPCYEWEGLPECPEREARFAAAYLAAHPESPFRDLLVLLEAHRWLCAAEAYEFEKQPEFAAQRRQQYEQALGRALASRHVLVAPAAQALAARNHCHNSAP